EVGRRFEFLLRRFSDQVLDPWSLAAFTMGNLAYQGTKLALLSRLVGSPVAESVAPGAAMLSSGLRSFGVSVAVPSLALGMESATMVLTEKVGRQLTESRQDWRLEALGEDWLRTGITLFCLKGAGALSQRAYQELHGLDTFTAQPQRLV